MSGTAAKLLQAVLKTAKIENQLVTDPFLRKPFNLEQCTDIELPVGNIYK